MKKILTIENLKKYFQNNAAGLFLLIIPTVYVFISAHHIRLPGLQYDEILFGNAAYGGDYGPSFIEFKVGSFPILLLQYIGALKAYFYFPIFKVFGVTLGSIRLPMIFLTAISIYLISIFSKEIFGKRATVITAILLTVNASMIFFTRTDVGPNAFEFFFVALSLYSFAKFLNKPTLITIAIFSFCMFLGTFNKLNFIWFVNGILFSVAIFFGKSIIIKFKELSKKEAISQICVFLLGIGLTYLYYIVIVTHFNISLRSDFHVFGEILFMKIRLLSYVISGVWFLSYLFGSSMSRLSFIYVGIQVGFVLFGVISLRLRNRNSHRTRFIYLVCLISLVILLQVVITGKATAGWHIFLLVSFCLVLFVNGLVEAMFFLKKLSLNRYFVEGIFAILVFFMLGYNLNLVGHYFDQVKSGKFTNSAWSNDIYDLSEYTKNHEGVFFSIDWGIHNQLLAFDRKENKYVDSWQFVENDQSADGLNKLLVEYSEGEEPIYLIGRADEVKSDRKYLSTTKKMLKRNGFRFEEVKTDESISDFVVLRVYPKK